MGCDAVKCGIDYILHFIAIDIDHYQKLIESLPDRDIGIVNYFSHVRSNAIKEDLNQLLPTLIGGGQRSPAVST